MFCSSPTGESFIYEVEHLLGYISCEKCKIICKQTADNFISTSLFGKVQHLKCKNIKIKRTNNTIEDGWTLYPLTDIIEGIECVLCKHNENNKEKWCSIDSVIELNK